jgi:hypothetical protein
MLRRVALVRTNDSEEGVASTFRVGSIQELRISAARNKLYGK